MNRDMLRCICALANWEKGVVDESAFLSKYPWNESTMHDLEVLNAAGYVSAFYADNNLYSLAVNPSGLERAK